MAATFQILMDNRYGKISIRLIQISLGLLFIYASLDKIWNPGLFAKAIANYRILPLEVLHLSAIILPWLELVCGLALVFNRYQRAATLLIMGMLIVFILAILSAMSRGLDFNCGCFSVDSTESNMGIQKILQNLGLLFSCGLLEVQHRLEQKGIFSKA